MSIFLKYVSSCYFRRSPFLLPNQRWTLNPPAGSIGGILWCGWRGIYNLFTKFWSLVSENAFFYFGFEAMPVKHWVVMQSIKLSIIMYFLVGTKLSAAILLLRTSWLFWMSLTDIRISLPSRTSRNARAITQLLIIMLFGSFYFSNEVMFVDMMESFKVSPTWGSPMCTPSPIASWNPTSRVQWD